MSYILDALRKSDQLRQRGLTHTLQTDYLAAHASRRPPWLVYGVPGLILVGAGILIGWWRPWQVPQPVPVASPLAAQPLEAAPQPIATATPIPAQSVLSQNAPEHVKVQTPSAGTAPATGAAIPLAAAPVTRAAPAAVAPESTVMAIADLPAALRQEIPAMIISVHAYSPQPANRMVSINNLLLREGGNLPPGLTLNEITADGMVFSYKGYRFRRGLGSAESR